MGVFFLKLTYCLWKSTNRKLNSAMDTPTKPGSTPCPPRWPSFRLRGAVTSSWNRRNTEKEKNMLEEKVGEKYGTKSKIMLLFPLKKWTRYFSKNMFFRFLVKEICGQNSCLVSKTGVFKMVLNFFLRSEIPFGSHSSTDGSLQDDFLLKWVWIFHRTMMRESSETSLHVALIYAALYLRTNTVMFLGWIYGRPLRWHSAIHVEPHHQLLNDFDDLSLLKSCLQIFTAT